MNPEENIQTPWQKLTDDERRKIKNTKVIIDNQQLKYSEIDELDIPFESEKFFNSLTEEQISDIQAGKVLKFSSSDLFESSSLNKPVTSGYDEDARHESVQPDRSMSGRFSKIIKADDQKFSTQQKAPFEELSAAERDQIIKTKVKVPGGETELGLFIDKTGNDNDKISRVCNKLTQEEIKEIQNGTFVVFEELVDSLDDFESEGNRSSRQRSFESESQNEQSSNRRFNNNNRDSSNSPNNNDGNRRNEENNEAAMEINLYSARVFISDLPEFIKILLREKTILILKPSMKDLALNYIYKYLKTQRILSNLHILYFYRDYHKLRASECLDEIIKNNETSIVKQLKILYGRKLSNFESDLLEQKYKNGEIFFMIDNLEFLQNIDNREDKEELRSKLLEILIEIKNNTQQVQIEKNTQLIVTNRSNASCRKEELKCETYCFEREEIYDNREIPGLIDLGVDEKTTKPCQKIILNLQKFHIDD